MKSEATHKLSVCLIFAALVFLLSLVNPMNRCMAKAQSNDDALLDELDNDILDNAGQIWETTESSDEKGCQLLDNFSGAFRTRYYYFFRPVEDLDSNMDTTRHFIEGTVEFKTFYHRESSRFNLSGWAEAGNQEQTYSGISDEFQDNDSRRNYLAVNELFFSRFYDTFNFILGKKKFIDGLSTIYSPANRYGALDVNDPLDPKALGTWLGQVDVPLRNVVATIAVFPIYQKAKLPSEDSRWADRSKWNFSAFTKIDEEIPGFSWENLNYFFRTKGSFQGWDLFLSLFQGFNQYPVIRQEIDGITVRNISEVVDVFNLATGFSTTAGKWEFHGEGLYNYTYDGKDDNYIDYVVGLTYGMDDYARKIGLQKIDFVLEFGGEVVLKRQYADNYSRSSEEARPMKENLITKILIHLNDDLKFRFLNEIELKDKGYFIQVGMEYKVAPRWKMDIDVEYFDGPSEDSYLGHQRKNDRFVTAIKYSF